MAEKNENKKDPFDGEYIGNIWGWKFSLIGGVFIALLLCFAAYRHYTMGVPLGMEDPEVTNEVLTDSIAQKDTIR